MSRYEKGMSMRRQVLGDDHVDRTTAAASDVDRDFQRWITESVWGGLWSRPQIDLRERSMVTIAILGALGHEELELHLQAAHNTGLDAEDISEVLLHVAAYAGAPAANRAFKTMKSIYEEGGS
ncbi:MAG: 4-carboxymuconolactone decarboxylase [Acidimicrobiia bacterium]|nr:4-carboxymuconolactone decarboxylase [Acidimicrobiia bacterium]